MSESKKVVERLRKDLAAEVVRAEPEASAERLRTALQMADAGIEMMRLNLRREHPGASPAEISERLKQWLENRQPVTWGRLAKDRMQNL